MKTSTNHSPRRPLRWLALGRVVTIVGVTFVGAIVSSAMAQFSATDTQTVSIGYTLGNSVDAPDEQIDISLTNVAIPSTPTTDEYDITYTFATSTTDLTAEITQIDGNPVTSPVDHGLAQDASNYFTIGLADAAISSLNNGNEFLTVEVDGPNSSIFNNYGSPATHVDALKFAMTRAGTGPGDNFDKTVEITFTVANQ